MRALVDLYHQSESFITKANLSSRIDEAFIHRRQPVFLHQQMPTESSMARLETDLYQRRNRPKFGQMVAPTAHKGQDEQVREGKQWSEQRTGRELAVFSALYGVFGRARPGYDALMDQQRGPEVEEEVGEVDALEAEVEAEAEQPRGEQQ